MLLAALLLQAAAPPPGPPGWPTREQCEREYGPRRTFSGLWVDDFEGQWFYEGVTQLSDLDWTAKHAWIDIDLDDAVRRLHLVRRGYGRAFRVTIEGEARINQPPPLCFVFDYTQPGHIRDARMLSWTDLGPVR